MPVVGTSRQVRERLKVGKNEMNIRTCHTYRKAFDCRTREVVGRCPCLRVPLTCEGNHSTVSLRHVREWRISMLRMDIAMMGR